MPGQRPGTPADAIRFDPDTEPTRGCVSALFHFRPSLHFVMHSISCFRAWARLFLVPTLFITGGAAALSAQTAVAPPTQLAPVVVPGRETDLVGSATSAAQGVIGARELEARPFLRRGELLEVIRSGDAKRAAAYAREHVAGWIELLPTTPAAPKA